MNRQAVIVDVFKLQGGVKVSLSSIASIPTFTDRIMSLEMCNKFNANFLNRREVVVINFKKTFEEQENPQGWVNEFLTNKKTELKNLKREIKFPINDDYREALLDGVEMEKTNQYIEVVENQIDAASELLVKRVRRTKEQIEKDDKQA